MSTIIPPTLELKEEIREKVQKFLEEIYENVHRKVGQTVRLACNNHITELVLMNLPESHLAWDINGEPMTMDPSRVFYYKGNIDITDLTPSDTGVYECVVKWTSGNVRENVTVGIYSLQVTAASTTRYIYEYEPMKLQCNSESLGRLFPAATRQWLFNDKPWGSLSVMLADNGSVEVISRVGKNQSGVWQCQVTHSRTGRVWDTAWMNVTVEDQPAFIARWYRHMVEHAGIVYAVLGLVIVVSFLVFVYSAYQIKRREDEADLQYMKERSGWEDLLSGFAEKGSITVEDFPEAAEEKEAVEGGENEDGGTEDRSELGEEEEEGEDKRETDEDESKNAAARYNVLKRDKNRSNRLHGGGEGAALTVEESTTGNRTSLTGAAVMKGSRGRSRSHSRGAQSTVYPAATEESMRHWLKRFNPAAIQELDSNFNKAPRASLVDSGNAPSSPPSSSSGGHTSGEETLTENFLAGSHHGNRKHRRAAPEKPQEAVQGSSRVCQGDGDARGTSRYYIKPWLSRHTYAVYVDHAGSKRDIRMKKLERGVKYSRLSQIEDDSV